MLNYTNACITFLILRYMFVYFNFKTIIQYVINRAAKDERKILVDIYLL